MFVDPVKVQVTKTQTNRRVAELRHLLAVLATFLICLALQSAQPQAAKTPTDLVPGQVMEKVICDGDSTESYALYLPSSYTTTKRWPIIYAFDPDAMGKHPVELYREVAEKYGFVIAGSNTSRNFSKDEAKSMSVIWEDTHSRLQLDPRRIYTMGFSGGARMAGAMAVGCKKCEISGVIAHGAGYPTSHASADDGLLYFFAVGDRDFNWSEVITIRREREERGQAYRVRTFTGSHQWAPREVIEDAVTWLKLGAMRLGYEVKDDTFIDGLFRRTQAEALEAEKVHDSIAQLLAYRSLVSDFVGLRNVSECEIKLATLKKSSELKIALKKEQEEIDEQAALENRISPKLKAFAEENAADPVALGSEISQEMALLKRQKMQAKTEVQRLIAARAFAGLWADGIESGQMEFESRHFDRAAACFQLMSDVSDEIWPVLLLAEARTAQGKNKQALQSLHEAVRRGLKDPEILEKDDNLRALQSQAEFKKIVEELKGNR
jgi:dienelactone hydrolase